MPAAPRAMFGLACHAMGWVAAVRYIGLQFETLSSTTTLQETSMDNPSVTLTQRQGYQFEHHYAPDIPVLLSDEPAPQGTGLGPDPVELLASAVGNCLSASIWFASQKYKDDPSPL